MKQYVITLSIIRFGANMEHYRNDLISKGNPLQCPFIPSDLN